MLQLQGLSAIALDSKGRISIPTKHRHVFVEADGSSHLTMTRHPDGCLSILPRSIWMVKSQALSKLPMSTLDWKRIFIGSATDLELDANGRVVIPPELRDRVGLKCDGKAMMMGMIDHFELWEVEVWNKRESKAIDGGIPEAIANFVF